MTPQLYTKLTAQIERQQPELAAYQAQADALQPTIDSAQQWVDACQAQVDKISAAINALRERPADAPEDWQAPDTSAQQAALDAATDTLNQALKDLAAPTAVQAGLLERAAALRAAIGQCEAALAASGVTMTPAEVDAQRLAALRADLWERIKAHRDQRKAMGVLVAGKWFHSDADSRIQQLGLVMMGAGIPAGLQWKTMDGSFVTMTQALAGAIFQATAASDMTIFAVAEQHRAALNASADPAAYAWQAGWPAVFAG